MYTLLMWKSIHWKNIRRMGSRLKEHKDACSQGQWQKSAIAEHAWRHDHCIEWDDAAVIDRASRHKEFLVKEALHIQTAAGKNSLNRDGGVKLHDWWIATVKRCERLWQHDQCSEHVTPASSNVPSTIFMLIHTSLQGLYDSALRHHTSLWDWMTQLMDHHLGLEYTKRPVLNATHCLEEEQCNLVET